MGSVKHFLSFLFRDSVRYTHTQLTVATVWNVNHKLNDAFPSVSIYNSSGKQISGVVQSVDTMNLAITFSKAVKGYAECR